MQLGAQLLQRLICVAVTAMLAGVATPAQAQFTHCTPPAAAPEAIRTPVLIRSVSRSTQAIQGIRISPDGQLIAVGQNDRRIRVWNIESGELVMETRALGGPLWDVMFTEDGTQLLSFGPEQGTMSRYRWTIATGESVRIEDHEGAWGLIRGGPGNDSESRDRTRRFEGGLGNGRLIDQATGRDVAVIDAQAGVGAISDSFFSYDGSALAIVHSYHTRIIDGRTGEQRALLCETLNGASGGAFSADGKYLIDVEPLNADTQNVAVWDTTTGAIIARVPIVNGSTWDIDISGDGQLIAISTQSGVTSIYRLTP